MTKEHLNEIMAGLCRKLKIRKSDLVAVHEAGMVAQGIDSNAIPYGLDFLLLNGTEDGTVREFTFDGFDIHLLGRSRGHGFPSPRPRGHLKDDSQVSELQIPDGAEGRIGGAAALRRYGR